MKKMKSKKAAGPDKVKTTAKKPSMHAVISTAKNQTELAATLGCERITIRRWREEHKDFPKPRANGRWDIEAVKKWALENGKLIGSGRQEPADLTAGTDEGETFSDLRKKELRVSLELRELELRKVKAELVEMSEAKRICLEILSPLGRRIKDMAANIALKVNPQDPTHAKAELKVWSNETLNQIQEICEKLKK